MTSIDEFELPKACVMRVIKAALPDNALINKEAKVVMTKSATIFINYLTATANDVTKSTNKKILSANDIFSALETLEFDEFSDKLREALEEYRKIQKLKSKRTQQNKNNNNNNKNGKSKGKDKEDNDEGEDGDEGEEEEEVEEEEEDLNIDSDNDSDINVEDEEEEEKEDDNEANQKPSKAIKGKKSKKAQKHSKLVSESDAESISDSESSSNSVSGSESESESGSEAASENSVKLSKKRKAGDTSFDNSSKKRRSDNN